MIKSELIKRVASQNPRLFQRDIDKIVNVILDKIVEALRRGDRIELRAFGVFSAKLRGACQGRNPRTASPSRERKCERGLIGKPCRQTDPRHSSALTNKGEATHL
jgi:integration host factor subunit beta